MKQTDIDHGREILQVELLADHPVHISAQKPKGKPFERGNKWAWKPGTSGNPVGRRPGYRALSEAYRHALARPLPDDPSKSYADAIAEVLCDAALAGDVAAVKELADRSEGRPRYSVEVSTDSQRYQLFERAVEEIIHRAAEVGETISFEDARTRLAGLLPEVAGESLSDGRD